MAEKKHHCARNMVQKGWTWSFRLVVGVSLVQHVNQSSVISQSLQKPVGKILHH